MRTRIMRYQKLIRSIPTEVFWGALLVVGLGLATRAARAENAPECFESVSQIRLAALDGKRLEDQALLARLIYAESLSAQVDRLDQCRADALAYRELLAWGVRSRLRTERFGRTLAEVVFKPAQFRPAVSERSEYSRSFRCPPRDHIWEESVKVGRQVWNADWSQSPFGNQAVTHFYYPLSSQATTQPPSWARQHQHKVVPLRLRGKLLSGDCIWFFKH